jgi:hypothetical protein
MAIVEFGAVCGMNARNPQAKPFVVSRKRVAYIPRAMQDFHPGEWCFDPYAKHCERCDTVVGRYAVMTDEAGFRNVLFWPHSDWDGVPGSSRCRAHSKIKQQWIRLF